MEASEHARQMVFRQTSPLRTPRAYRICDGMTEALLYFMAVFAPWAFGTTERWSIWTMNLAAYALGALWFAKWSIRWRTGYRPMRWGGEADEVRSPKPEPGKEGVAEKTRNRERGTWDVDGQARSMAKLLTGALAK